MLIISRKAGESFLIGDSIEIVILESQSEKITVGIKAPKDVTILRKELYEIQKANKESAYLTDSGSLTSLKNILTKNN